LNAKTFGKYLAFALIFIAIGSGSTIGALVMMGNQSYSKYYVDLGINLKTDKTPVNVQVAVRHFINGSYEAWQNQSVHNIVVNNGLTRTIQLWYGNASNPTNCTDFISLSNDASAVATWLKLAGEITNDGLQRVAGTPGSTTKNSFTAQYTFTDSTAPNTVQCAGLSFSGGAGYNGGLFAAATYTQVTLNINDQIQITWTGSAATG
jgi:hypothetical protein